MNHHHPLGRLSSKFRPAPSSKVLQGRYQELEDDPTRALLCHGSNGDDDDDESPRRDCYPYYYETIFSSPRQQQQPQVSCWDFEPDWSQLAQIIQQGQGPSMKASPFIGDKMKRTRRLAFNRLLCYRHRGAQEDDNDEMEVETHVSLSLDDAALEDFFLDRRHQGPLLLTIGTPLSHMVTVIEDRQGRGISDDDFSLSLRSGSTGNNSAMSSQARSASDETMDAIAKLSSPYVYQQASQPQQQGILLVAQTAAQHPTVVSMQHPPTGTTKRKCCIINPLDMELFLRKGQQEKKNRKNKKYWNNGKAQVEKWSDDNNDDDDVSSISSASTGSTSGKRRLF